MSEVLAVTLNSLFERVKYAFSLIVSLRVHIYLCVRLLKGIGCPCSIGTDDMIKLSIMKYKRDKKVENVNEM